MRYTLGKAKKRLAASTSAYGQTDLRDLINQAIEALSGLNGWECLRKVLRFSSVGPGFVLPQGCAGLVRACVNGSPTTVRGPDFRFLQSGPGEKGPLPYGFAPVKASNIYDLGMKPVMRELPRPFRIYAIASGTDNPPLIVRGLSPGGETLRVSLRPVEAPVYDEYGAIIKGYEYTMAPVDSQELFQVITEVTIDPDSIHYVYLYGEDDFTKERYFIGQYHPAIEAPEFRHYMINGVPPDAPLDLLVETRVDPLPLVEDTDVVPLPSLEPIEWMIRADWQMKAGETTAAQKYQDMAVRWLKSQEVTNDSMQTSVVVNSVFEGSPGEISMESINI